MSGLTVHFQTGAGTACARAEALRTCAGGRAVCAGAVSIRLPGPARPSGGVTVRVVDGRRDLRAAEAFVAVAERRAIGVVAVDLGVSRRTLAGRLSAYEAAVGRTLIDRSHRRVVALTAAGHALLPSARRFVAAAGAHGEALAAVASGTVGVVRIGVFPSSTPLTDALVLSLRRVDPAWRVEVTALRPQPLKRALAFGELDAALTTRLLPDPNWMVPDPRPRRFETVHALRIGPGLYPLVATWRTRWTGPHAEAFFEAAATASRVLRRGRAVRYRPAVVSPDATGWHPGR